MNAVYIVLSLICFCVGLYLLFDVLYRKKQTKFKETRPDFIAIHEIGHAICAWQCSKVYRVYGAFIHSSRQMGLCKYYIHYNNIVEKEKINCEWSNLVIMLGGIAAELIFLGKFRSENAKEDLERAFDCASLISCYNFEIPISPKVYELKSSLNFKKVYKNIVDKEAEVLTIGLSVAKFIIEQHKDECLALAQILYEHREVREKELSMYLKDTTWKLFENKYIFRA